MGGAKNIIIAIIISKKVFPFQIIAKKETLFALFYKNICEKYNNSSVDLEHVFMKR